MKSKSITIPSMILIIIGLAATSWAGKDSARYSSSRSNSIKSRSVVRQSSAPMRVKSYGSPMKGKSYSSPVKNSSYNKSYNWSEPRTTKVKTTRTNDYYRQPRTNQSYYRGVEKFQKDSSPVYSSSRTRNNYSRQDRDTPVYSSRNDGYQGARDYPSNRSYNQRNYYDRDDNNRENWYFSGSVGYRSGNGSYYSGSIGYRSGYGRYYPRGGCGPYYRPYYRRPVSYYRPVYRGCNTCGYRSCICRPVYPAPCNYGSRWRIGIGYYDGDWAGAFSWSSGYSNYYSRGYVAVVDDYCPPTRIWVPGYWTYREEASAVPSSQREWSKLSNNEVMNASRAEKAKLGLGSWETSPMKSVSNERVWIPGKWVEENEGGNAIKGVK